MGIRVIRWSWRVYIQIGLPFLFLGAKGTMNIYERWMDIQSSYLIIPTITHPYLSWDQTSHNGMSMDFSGLILKENSIHKPCARNLCQSQKTLACSRISRHGWWSATKWIEEPANHQAALNIAHMGLSETLREHAQFQWLITNSGAIFGAQWHVFTSLRPQTSRIGKGPSTRDTLMRINIETAK